MKVLRSMQPGRRGAQSAAARPAPVALLPAVVLAILFMAGCSQSSGTEQASQEQQQRNDELQQQVDDLKKEQEEQKEQKQQEEQAKQQEELQQQVDDLEKEQQQQQQQPQVVVERNEVVGTAAPEGRVVITPDATYAGTAQESAALDAAIAYYEAAELGDYAYTYNALVGADRVRYSYQDWLYANEQLDSAAGEFVIFSVEGTYVDHVRVGLTVYTASGDASDRYTDFVYENGAWRHSLTAEEYALFDGAL